MPYSTLHDICSHRTKLLQCTCETAIRISQGLDISVDELLGEETLQYFRDSIHHRIRREGAPQFILDQIEQDSVRRLWKNGRKVQALYLLALLDVLCEREDLPLIAEYDQLRRYRLQEPLFMGDSWMDKEHAVRNAIPGFLSYNIVEGDLFDAV